MQTAVPQVGQVHVRDLELAPARRFEPGGDVHHPFVVEVEPRNRVV